MHSYKAFQQEKLKIKLIKIPYFKENFRLS